jgi:signal transduction histidine kinase
VIQIGLVYAGVYLLCAAYALPAAPEVVQEAVPDLAVVLLAGGACWAARRAHVQARGSERVFWALLAGAAGAQLAHSVLFLLRALLLPGSGVLRTAGQMGYYTFVVLVLVALLVRPDRPRAGGNERAATIERLMAVGALYFVAFYFLLLPARARPFPWLLVFTLQHVVPAAWALALAVRAGRGPFRPVFALLASGFAAAALTGIVAHLRHGGEPPANAAPYHVMWMFPMLGLAAAALCPRGPVWVRAVAPERRSDRGRARLAVAAVALPPLVDLAARALGLAPELADTRSEATLVAIPLLAVLAALRLRLVSAAPPPAGGFAVDSPEVRAALGVPSECLQFASGVAHELNNPLMAVVGWAELSLRRDGDAPAVRQLMDAAHHAAEVVQRLQRIAQAGEKVTPAFGVDK